MYAKLALLAVLVFSIVAMPANAQDNQQIEIEAEGIALAFNSAIASGADAEVVPAVPLDDQVPMFGAWPEHVMFSFTDYAAGPDTFHEPRIRVYATADFADYSISDDYGDYGYGPTATALADLLEEQPDLEEFETDMELPLLPVWNAAQVIRSQMAYVEFDGGKGIRFLSYYSQAPMPILNSEVFYTFQGLTDDGDYYISAILPVNPGILEDEMELDDFDWNAFAENFEDYIVEVTADLDALAADDFAPSLDLLDEMIASITIE